MKEIFKRIFEDNIWRSPVSRSGEGSDLIQTAVIRKEIPRLIQRLEVKSILDIPCGDFHWMQFVDLGSTQYVGGDIVQEIVQKNQAAYSTSTRRFDVIDITTSPLPDVDMIFCRDVFVHFSFEDIAKAFDNIARSNARFLLTTTFPTRTINESISTGAWRPLNLCLEPLNLPEPLEIINEGCTEWDGHWADKSLGLWAIADLKTNSR